MISNVTGMVVTEEEISLNTYWKKHLMGTVKFAQGMESLAHEVGCDIFIEVGPDPVLVKMGRQCLQSKANFEWIPSLNKDDTEGGVTIEERVLSLSLVMGLGQEDTPLLSKKVSFANTKIFMENTNPICRNGFN